MYRHRVDRCRAELVLARHAGAGPARQAWEQHPAWRDPDGALPALQDAAEAAAALPPPHQHILSCAERNFFQPPAKQGPALPAWPPVGPPQHSSADGGPGSSMGYCGEVEVPARRAVSPPARLPDLCSHFEEDCQGVRATLAQSPLVIRCHDGI